MQEELKFTTHTYFTPLECFIRGYLNKVCRNNSLTIDEPTTKMCAEILATLPELFEKVMIMVKLVP